MDKLDRLFREKLQKREFEFKESYWEQAQAMIEEQEQSRWPRMLWNLSRWSFLLLLSIFLIGDTFYWLQANTVAEVQQTKLIDQVDSASSTATAQYTPPLGF